MDYTIKNDKLTVVISDKGAEMMSIKKDGCEYLWQGDSKYWEDRALNLFPICGTFFDGKYTYKGKEYEMESHGFAQYSKFEVVEQKTEKIVFLLKANEEIKKIYPFDFEYLVEYVLNDNTIEMKYTAKNLGENTMYSAFGGHPGFNVPLAGEGNFEDYYIEFGCVKPAKQMLLDGCYITGNDVLYDLEDGKILRLKHNLFDHDGIFLRDVCHTLTLKSDKTAKSVTVKYPDFQYVGFWHEEKTDAPFVCVEPWQSVPSYAGVSDDIETKRDMFPLEKGEERSATIYIAIK